MDRFVFAIYRLLSGGLGLLPLAAVFRLGWSVGTLAYFVAWPYRRLVLRNLQIAFDGEQSPVELRALARRHFATLGANIFSSLKLPHMSRDEILAVVKIEGLEVLKAANDAGCGIVNIVSHLGNWEIFAQLSPIVFPCPSGTIFQALSNRFIDAEVRRDRARLGLALFEKKEGFIEACKFMRAGGAVGVLADQHAGDIGQWSPFFGRLASTTTLPATLALRTGAWLIPTGVHTIGVAQWRAVFGPRIEPLGETAEEITVRVNAAIERQIREQPADWFWVHNRWKTPRPKFLLSTYKRGATLGAGQSAASLKPFKILIRGSNWLGDAVMSMPAVRAIKRGRIDAQVTVLTPAKLADLWKSVPEVDAVISIESGENVFAVARKIRRDFDVAIVLPNSLRTALEPWLAGIPRRVGYPGHRRRALLNQVFTTKKKKLPAPPRHQVHHYLALAEFVGADPSPGTGPFPQRPAAPRATAPVIGLCPGAEYGAAKRWLPERYAEVVGAIHKQTGAEWRIFGVAKDRPVVDVIVAQGGVSCTDRVGQTTLAELMDELRACDLLLTNDTGTMHLATMLGVPTVSLFGSTEPSLTGPLGDGHRVLRHHVDCSPCFLRDCPLDFRCMTGLKVPDVINAVLAALPVRT